MSFTHLQRIDILPVARATILENMADGVMVLDAQNRVMDLNPAMHLLIGCTPSKAIGQPVNLMQLGRPCTDDVPMAEITFRRPLKFHNRFYWRRKVAVIQRSCEGTKLNRLYLWYRFKDRIKISQRFVAILFGWLAHGYADQEISHRNLS